MSYEDPHILSGLGDILNADNIRSGTNVKATEIDMISGGPTNAQPKESRDQFIEALREASLKLGITYGEPVIDKPTEMTPVEPKTEITEPPVQESILRIRSPPLKQKTDYDLGPEMNERTQEQRRRDEITSVMGFTESTPILSIEKEKKDDDISKMLAEIDVLMSSLTEDGVDVTRTETVNRHSSFDAIKSVLDILRYKNDLHRSCSMVEEISLATAGWLGDVFNGENSYFGYTPNLKGWDSHLQTKLIRRRPDTSAVVGDIMRGTQFSPLVRLGFEIIPSMILHSQRQKRSHEQLALYNDADIQRATNNLKNIQDK